METEEDNIISLEIVQLMRESAENQKVFLAISLPVIQEAAEKVRNTLAPLIQEVIESTGYSEERVTNLVRQHLGGGFLLELALPTTSLSRD